MPLLLVGLVSSLMAFNPDASRSAAYPGQRRANDPILEAIMKASVGFWRARGVNVEGIPLDVADDINEAGEGFAAGRGLSKKTYGEARVILDGKEVGIRLKRIRSKRRGAAERRKQVQFLGGLIAHELGHSSGMEHSAEGIMQAQLTSSNVPWEIKLLARKLVREKDKKRKKGSPARGGGEDF